MSLFDKLNNGETKLKSLKYGNDREGGGSSNQPYIKSPLDADLPSALDFLGNDFILRGGPIGAPLATANDVARLSKYFTDLKSPSGLLFTIKQNLLSRVAAQTQASNKLINGGVYTPLSTLTQAGSSAFGFHFNKQGLNPIPGVVGSLRTYSDVVTNPGTTPPETPISTLLTSLNNLTNRFNLSGNANGSNNRLQFLFDKHINIVNPEYNVLSYSGGPGSILGIGKTDIRFADQRTGLNNATLFIGPRVRVGANLRTNKNILSNVISTTKSTSPYSKFTVSGKYIERYGENNILDSNGLYNRLPIKFDLVSINNGNNNVIPLDQNKEPYNPLLSPTEDPNYTYSQEELIEAGKIPYRKNTQTLVDFRAKLRSQFDGLPPDIPEVQAANNILGNSPDYSGSRLEIRTYLGDPGNSFKKDLRSYEYGYNGSSAASPNSFDKINALTIYQSTGPDLTKPINDLVKFRIATIDNSDPTKKVYIHFRAFLGSINDSYTGNWNSQRYIGRGENFYTYDGFDRKISLSFTTAAQSKLELIPMYQKLNYLASNLAPDYSKSGYMRGPLITLTIGGYLYEQPGFITGLSYEMSEESPWEIGINDNGESDESVKELSHIIKVNSFNFTPIHNFTPRKQDNTFDPKTGKLIQFGEQRYIALEAVGNNYSNIIEVEKTSLKL